MKSKFCLSLLLTFLLFPHLRAQDTRLWFTGIEAGYDYLNSYPADLNNIRGEMPAYYSDDVKSGIRGLCDKLHLGAKVETRSINTKFGLSGGLRYTRFRSSLGKDTYYDTPTDFFYYRFRDEIAFSEYSKIRSFTQNAAYISIPVELRYFPFIQRNFRVYFKTAGELGFLINHKFIVDFYNDEMNTVEEEVTGDFSDPSSFFSSLYFSGGIQIGRDGKPGLNLEVCFPYFFLTGHVSGLVIPEYGGGFHLSFQYPLNSKSHE